MKDAYVIMDTEEGRSNRLFFFDSPFRPWIVHSFTDGIKFAALYETREQAQEDCDRFMKEKYDFDGNTPLKPGRLRVRKVVFAPVPDGKDAI